jgi:capsular exopolysaccharide synthesis family protein
MSRIFDVVKKDNILDFDEICQTDSSDVTASSQSAKDSVCPIRPVSSPQHAKRIIRLKASASSPIFPFDGEHQAAAEQYRIIRTKIWQGPNKPHVVVVSSSSSGDGKTVTSINIAASLALKEDSRVLLVDGDLRHPRVSEALGIHVDSGLSEVLSGAVSLESAVIGAEQFPNLFILPAGNPGQSAAELLDSQRWHVLVEQIRAQFSNVIFDAPPIATVADYELLQLVCDGVILVARPDHSDRRAFFKVLETVPREKLLGVVLNCVEDWWLWKTPVYGYYGTHLSARRPE